MKSAIPALLLCFLVVSCHHSTEPTKLKDPRDYTWTVDTVSYSGSTQTMMYRIWGSSEHDVYTVGHNDQNRGLMWHYDGTKWTDVHLSTSQGGAIQGRIDLYDVFGVDGSHVWAVGEHLQSNLTPPPDWLAWVVIIEFNGSTWREVPMTRIDGTAECVWASSPADVWIGGTDGIMLHYDGSSVSRVAFPPLWHIKSITGIGPSQAYAIAWRYNLPGQDTVFNAFLSWNGSTWNLLDSTVFDISNQKFGANSVSAVGGTVYTCSPNIFRRTEGSWQLVFSSPIGGSIVHLSGTSTDNIFAVANHAVFLYNGNDWYPIIDLATPTHSFDWSWSNDCSMFAVATDGSQSYLLRGN